jgi:hypothetical protein
MSEKKISPSRGNARKFDLDVNTAQGNDFPDQGKVSIVLSGSSNYDIYQKDIPIGLKGKKTSSGKTIKWLNNFGLKLPNTDSYVKTETDEYTILLDARPGAEYVYDAGNGVIGVLQATPYTSDPTKVQAKLKLGDPSVGWG